MNVEEVRLSGFQGVNSAVMNEKQDICVTSVEQLRRAKIETRRSRK